MVVALFVETNAPGTPRNPALFLGCGDIEGHISAVSSLAGAPPPHFTSSWLIAEHDKCQRLGEISQILPLFHNPNRHKNNGPRSDNKIFLTLVRGTCTKAVYGKIVLKTLE